MVNIGYSLLVDISLLINSLENYIALVILMTSRPAEIEWSFQLAKWPR